MLVKSVAGICLFNLRTPLHRTVMHFEAQAGGIVFDPIPMVADRDELPARTSKERGKSKKAGA
jgi:hypothetical protein